MRASGTAVCGSSRRPRCSAARSRAPTGPRPSASTRARRRFCLRAGVGVVAHPRRAARRGRCDRGQSSISSRGASSLGLATDPQQREVEQREHGAAGLGEVERAAAGLLENLRGAAVAEDRPQLGLGVAHVAAAERQLGHAAGAPGRASGRAARSRRRSSRPRRGRRGARTARRGARARGCARGRRPRCGPRPRARGRCRRCRRRARRARPSDVGAALGVEAHQLLERGHRRVAAAGPAQRQRQLGEPLGVLRAQLDELLVDADGARELLLAGVELGEQQTCLEGQVRIAGLLEVEQGLLLDGDAAARELREAGAADQQVDHARAGLVVQQALLGAAGQVEDLLPGGEGALRHAVVLLEQGAQAQVLRVLRGGGQGLVQRDRRPRAGGARRGSRRGAPSRRGRGRIRPGSTAHSLSASASRPI